MAKNYAVGVGSVLLILGLLGFGRGNNDLFGLHFNTMHNTIHLLSGLIGLWAGFGKNASAPRLFAQVFGAIYTLVAILGFAHMPASLNDMLTLNPPYNVIHLIVGLLGLVAGFMGARQTTAA